MNLSSAIFASLALFVGFADSQNTCPSTVALNENELVVEYIGSVFWGPVTIAEDGAEIGDTELNLWTAQGSFIENADDTSLAELKPLLERTLGPGCYVVGGGGFSADANSMDNFELQGSSLDPGESGNFEISVNDGITTLSGSKFLTGTSEDTVQPSEAAYFCFCAVADPNPPKCPPAVILNGASVDVDYIGSVLEGPITIVEDGADIEDTELNLWRTRGSFIDNNDDDGPGRKPVIERQLSAGCYVVGGGGFSADANTMDNFVLQGSSLDVGESGSFEISVADGTTTLSGTKFLTGASGGVQPSEAAYFCFAVGDVSCVDVGSGGDPHFKLWNGKLYDFHGACDLVLLHAPLFGHGLGLDIHVRTTSMHQYSYIETAAFKIGDDVLEISSWGQYFLNGVEAAELPATMGSGLYAITYKHGNKKDHWFEIKIDAHAKIIVKTHKNLVSVTLDGSLAKHMEGSVGMLGSASGGKMLGRDGGTNMEDDVIGFSKQWQVNDTEQKLFQDKDRHPQYPQACVMPDLTKEERRRLGQKTISLEVAASACRQAGRIHDAEACVYDVLATGDFELAAAGAF